ncbi:MAG TPA: hypothetical protein VGM29_07625 [Polyangiaceae bacterium]
MKFEIVSRYLARVYMKDPRSTPVLMRLAADLAEKAGMSDSQPSLVNDYDVATGEVSQGCVLTSSDQTWLVKLTGESFDVQVSQGYNVATRAHLHAPSFQGYLKRVRELFEVGMSLVAVKPHRIAVVQSGVLARAEGKATSLEAVRSQLMRFPSVGEGVPFEWNWRGAWKITRQFGDRSEVTNTIASVRLADVAHVERLGERLVVELDINTDPIDPTPRFSMEEVLAFVSESEGWHAQLAEALATHAGIES